MASESSWGDTWGGILESTSDAFFSTLGKVKDLAGGVSDAVGTYSQTKSNVQAAGRAKEPAPIYTSGIYETQASRDLNRGTTGQYQPAGLFGVTADLSTTEILLLFGAGVVALYAFTKL